MIETDTRSHHTSGPAMARWAFVFVAIGALIGAALIISIAAAVDGVWRFVVLALLTPVLVLSLLLLFRSARSVSALGAERALTIAELREKGVFGVLAAPELGTWEERVNRKLLLPAGPHLLFVGPRNADTEEGQRRLRLFYTLIGTPPQPGQTASLPDHAAIVVLHPETVETQVVDLSDYFARADAGDEEVQQELLSLEEYVQSRALDAVRSGR